MFKFIKKLFTGSQKEEVLDEIDSSNPEADELKIKIATCALFMAVAHADDNFAPIEREKIKHIMHETFQLNDNEINELLALSESQFKESKGVFEFSNIVKKYFSDEQKFHLIKNLWRLMYSDNNTELSEDYVIRKIAITLDIPHQIVVAAKDEVDSRG